MERTHLLRKLIVRLDVSGDISTIRNTPLYKDSFGFVLLQCYVPITQVARGSPQCTVHRKVIDSSGIERIFNNEKYNMLYVDDISLDGFKYMRFECPMPHSFTDTLGELNIIFNYLEIKDEDKILARLTSKEYSLYVSNGGATDEADLVLDIKSAESMQINANTMAIESMTDEINTLLLPPDTSEANQVGQAEVTIENGRFKFKNLKGATGETGATGGKGDTGEKGAKGDDGKDGNGIFAMNIEEGNLILYKQNVSNADFSIGSNGYLTVKLN